LRGSRPDRLNRAWALGIALLLVLGLAPAVFGAAPLDEEVEFACGLVQQKFYALALDEVLTPALVQRLETDEQKRRVYRALIAAHGYMAKRLRPDLPAAEEQKIRQQHQELTRQYEAQLRKLEGAAPEKGIDRYVGLRNEGNRLAYRIKTGQSKDVERMQELFDRAVKGLGEAAAAAKKALDAHYKTSPEFDDPNFKAANKRWEEKLRVLQQPYVRAAIELNYTRYLYYKALPDEKEAKRAELLQQTTEALEDLCTEYDSWVYTILGQLTLGNAYTDARKFVDAQVAFESGLRLLQEYVRADDSGRARREMEPWRVRLITGWGLAAAKLDKFDEAVDKLKELTTPEARLRLGEVLLMKARHADANEKPATARTARAQAQAVLGKVTAISDYWARRAGDLRARFALATTGWRKAFDRLKQAMTSRPRNNAGVIDSAIDLFTYGDDVPAKKRSMALAWLALAYWQEKMYLEAYTVYAHMAETDTGGNPPEKSAQFAVACLDRLYKQTNDAADKALLEAAKKWRREEYGGPGAEYEDGMALKKKGRYLQAIDEFRKVQEGSLYYESALEQIGECYVLQAKKLKQAKQNEAEMLRKGKAALERFLRQIQKGTPFPRVIQRRKRLRAAAVYRLATIDMWDGREEYKALLKRTESYAERFPETEVLHPYVWFLRLQARIGLGDLRHADEELDKIKKAAREAEEPKTAKALDPLIGYGNELLFNAYVKQSQQFRERAATFRKEAKKIEETDPDRAQTLRAQAEAADNLADEPANKALGIMKAAVAENPDQPYDKLYYLIYELDRIRSYNELPEYIEVFLNKFGDTKDVPEKRKREIEAVRVILGIALCESGQRERAYEVLKKQYETLDARYQQLLARWQRRRQTEPDAPRPKAPGQYWTVKLYLAKSAKALAPEDEKRGDEAMGHFVELHRMLERYESRDWWDVTLSIAQLNDLRGRDDDNLLLIGRVFGARPELGGPAFREGFVELLRGIHRRAKARRQEQNWKKAVDLLARLLVVDLKALREEGNYRAIVKRIDDFRQVEIDFGGREYKALLLPFAEEAATKAEAAEDKQKAERLVKDLKT
jgi:hypothetical protein